MLSIAANTIPNGMISKVRRKYWSSFKVPMHTFLHPGMKSNSVYLPGTMPSSMLTENPWQRRIATSRGRFLPNSSIDTKASGRHPGAWKRYRRNITINSSRASSVFKWRSSKQKRSSNSVRTAIRKIRLEPLPDWSARALQEPQALLISCGYLQSEAIQEREPSRQTSESASEDQHTDRNDEDSAGDFNGVKVFFEPAIEREKLI